MPRIKPSKKTRVQDIWFDDGMHVVFKDGLHAVYNLYTLRCACPCASCVDEVTGQKILEDAKVDPNISVRDSSYVGNYAMAITWSDGHSTGIFTFSSLRENIPFDEAPTA